LWSQGQDDSGVAEGSDDVALHLDDIIGRDRKLGRLEVLCLTDSARKSLVVNSTWVLYFHLNTELDGAAVGPVGYA